MKKREASQAEFEEDDYDDFSDTDKDTDASRSYVPLNAETENGEADAADSVAEETGGDTSEKSSFTPLSEQVAQTCEKAEDTVEEFFDEEDVSDEEPPIHESIE